MTGYKLEKIETPTADALATAPQLRDSSAIFNKRSVSDTSAAGKAVAELMKELDSGEAAQHSSDFASRSGLRPVHSSPLVKEKASALLSRLPSLLPDDPAMAAVIAEAMAAEFGAKIENVGTSEGARKGWETRRRNGWTSEQFQEFKSKICDLGHNSLSDPQYNDTVQLGKVDGDVVGDIKAATGFDVSGFEQEVSAQDIRHAYQQHGMPHVDKKGRQRGERRENQLPIGKGDFSRITDVYSTYDSIERGSPEHNSGQPTIRYKKKFDDGTLVCLEVIATKHKKLRFKDAWKEVPST